MRSDLLLYMLPFAGGHRNSYGAVRTALRQMGVDSVPLELPGHGSRIGEPLCSDIDEMEADLCRQILDHQASLTRAALGTIRGEFREADAHSLNRKSDRGVLNSPKIVLFGHSMGALLAYRIASSISEKVAGLILSGRVGPQVPLRRNAIHLLESEKFFQQINSFGGLPVEVLNDPELCAFIEPILRSDFRAVERVQPELRSRLRIPVSLLYGSEEEFHLDDLSAWNQTTSGRFTMIEHPGGHFGLLDDPELTARLIQNAINQSPADRESIEYISEVSNTCMSELDHHDSIPPARTRTIRTRAEHTLS